jgi:peptide/nickel transport system permease protein
MLSYVARRLLYALFVLLGVATVSFFMLRITGDPVLLMLPTDATSADVDRMRHLMGFDRPLGVQYLSFMGQLLQGSLGNSLRYHQPTLAVVSERIPATSQLASSAFLLTLALAVPLGVLSAVRKGTWVDSLGSVFALIGQATPVFWLGLMGILLFSVKLRWLPSQGRGGLENLVMPAITLGLYSAALTTRMLRSARAF